MLRLKNGVYKDNKKLYMHVSFVDVPILNSVYPVNMLFTILFLQPSEILPMVALEKQLLSSELFSACRVLQLSKNKFQYNANKQTNQPNF